MPVRNTSVGTLFGLSQGLDERMVSKNISIITSIALESYEFWPDRGEWRFLLHRLVFLGGPPNFITTFAKMEVGIVVATIVQSLRLRLHPSTEDGKGVSAVYRTL